MAEMTANNAKTMITDLEVKHNKILEEAASIVSKFAKDRAAKGNTSDIFKVVMNLVEPFEEKEKVIILSLALQSLAQANSNQKRSSESSGGSFKGASKSKDSGFRGGYWN